MSQPKPAPEPEGDPDPGPAAWVLLAIVFAVLAPFFCLIDLTRR